MENAKRVKFVILCGEEFVECVCPFMFRNLKSELPNDAAALSVAW